MSKRWWILLGVILDFKEIECFVSCYSCIEGESNTRCNVAGTISCYINQTCYTEVTRRPLVVKRYTKGCMDIMNCTTKMNLNDKMTCDETPSKCTYCCTAELCNASNKSTNIQIMKILYPLVFIFIHFS
ncbi:uncharacterized protein LOC134723204 [Mytilus trossulus]|uniref:uncharacterized protein LOC134723204 n=1 Tax=Mytilus trossulus TaxID=6551 RepID=UPI0030040A94